LRSSKQNTAYLALDAPLPIAKCSARHVVKSIGLSTAEENLDLLQKNPGSPQQFQQNPYRFSISSGFPGFRTSTPWGKWRWAESIALIIWWKTSSCSNFYGQLAGQKTSQLANSSKETWWLI
jgi:hypothetical protein